MSKNFPLEIISPDFGSELTDLIIDLDHLRRKELTGTTHPGVFFQLKHIFHTLESIGSARIEGNNTTIAEYIETKLENRSSSSQNIKEIQNIEKAMVFIEENIAECPIDRVFLSELHKMIVDGLDIPPKGEGDKTPDDYRSTNVKIAQSPHTPIDWTLVPEYMEELIEFVNSNKEPKYDLLKTAIAHHRFVWIHPFGNGNGRTVRLFTYAMLVKLGFNVNVGRILNPTAVFCSDRNDYYHFLSKADQGGKAVMLEWCTYVLKGLKDEIEKIDNLLDYNFLKREILNPAIEFSIERGYINEIESKILKKAIDRQEIQASNLKEIFKGKISAEISRQIRRLLDKKMLMPVEEGKRKYVIRFDNNYLLRGVINMLGEKGFLPVNDE